MTSDPMVTALEAEHELTDRQLADYIETDGPRDRQSLLDAIAGLRRHIFLEEECLFPALQDAEPDLTIAVLAMLRQHAQMWQQMAEIVIELRLDGPDSPAVIAGCRRLVVALMHHNGNEERLLYSRLPTLLTGETRERVRGQLDGAELPTNWRPRRAANP